MSYSNTSSPNQVSSQHGSYVSLNMVRKNFQINVPKQIVRRFVYQSIQLLYVYFAAYICSKTTSFQA